MKKLKLRKWVVGLFAKGNSLDRLKKKRVMEVKKMQGASGSRGSEMPGGVGKTGKSR